MKRYNRTDRVSQLLLREISTIIDHEMKDERVEMVTVTDVEVSRDLKNAKVFVSILGSDPDIDEIIGTLNGAVYFIKSLLRDRVVLKYLPDLTFYYDSSIVYGMHMDKLLDEIKREK